MKITYLAALLLTPAFVFAQTGSNPLALLITDVIDFIDIYLVPLVFALALISFLWGMFNFMILGGADEEKREKGKKFAVWSIIALFIMVSLWGIVNLLVGTFNFGGQQRPDLPTFKQGSGNSNGNGGGNGSGAQTCPEGEVPYASGCIPSSAPEDNDGCPPGTTPYASGCI